MLDVWIHCCYKINDKIKKNQYISIVHSISHCLCGESSCGRSMAAVSFPLNFTKEWFMSKLTQVAWWKQLNYNSVWLAFFNSSAKSYSGELEAIDAVLQPQIPPLGSHPRTYMNLQQTLLPSCDIIQIIAWLILQSLVLYYEKVVGSLHNMGKETQGT